MKRYGRRNFALHGNVDPIGEQIEIVYFDRRRPLFVNPGHNIRKFHDHLEMIYRPEELIKEYESLHIFLAEIVDCLESRVRPFFHQVIDDAYPGFELKKRRVTRILPDHIMMGFFDGMRFDDELNVAW